MAINPDWALRDEEVPALARPARPAASELGRKDGVGFLPSSQIAAASCQSSVALALAVAATEDCDSDS